jgi:hypothetical protein
MCAPVIQILLTRLTQNPCKKYLPGAALAITIAQNTNITTQKAGSAFSGISDMVAKAMISPKTESWRISFQFMMV